MFEAGTGDASVPSPRTAQQNARRVKQLENRVRHLEARLASDTSDEGEDPPSPSPYPHARGTVVTGSHGMAEVVGPDDAILAALRAHEHRSSRADTSAVEAHHPSTTDACRSGPATLGVSPLGVAAGRSRRSSEASSRGESTGRRAARQRHDVPGVHVGARGSTGAPAAGQDSAAALLQDRDRDSVRSALRSGRDMTAPSPPRSSSPGGPAGGTSPLTGRAGPDSSGWGDDAFDLDSGWLARGLGEESSASAFVPRPSTAEAALLTSDELFLRKVANNMRKLVAGRQPVVLVSTGAFNPIHLQHTRMFYLARAHLNERTEYQVVGGLVSPSHDNEVKNALRVFPDQAIPVRHRAAMCEIAVSGSSWLAVGRWEATRRRVMPYHSVLQHVQELLNKAFGGSAKPASALAAEEIAADLRGGAGDSSARGHAQGAAGPPSHAGSPARPGRVVPRVMYLCGADKLLQAGPQTLRTFGCICCARPGFTEELRSIVGRRYKRLVHVVDDDALLPTSLDGVSSTKVRRRLLAGKDVASLVGDAVGRYIRATDIASKLGGTSPWTDADKAPITYNAAVAVRAAQVQDAASAVLAAHLREDRGPQRKRSAAGAPPSGMSTGRPRNRGAGQRGPSAGAGPKVSPLLLPREPAGMSRLHGRVPGATRSPPAPGPGSRAPGAAGRRPGLVRAGVAILSTGSLPEFALGPSKAGPALGGGRGRRHWPGGELRPAGATPAKTVVSPSGGLASGRARPSVRLAAPATRRAWSGGTHRPGLSGAR